MAIKEESANLRKRYFIDRFVPYSATEYEVVRKTGLDIAIVREVLSSLETYYITTWPENLRTEILGYSEVVEMTDDQREGLAYVLGTLSEREWRCLYGHFRDDKTYKEIGTEFGVTTERIRQIICKAIRKLRHPTRINYILLGYKGAQARKARVEKEVSAIMAREEAEFKAQVTVELEKRRRISDGIPIENFDFSVRAYNCLKHAGIDTAEKLVPYLVDDSLLRIRNIGKKTAAEIKYKFDVYMAENIEEVKEK